MSTEQDIIQIILDVKDDEAQQAKQTLEALNNQAKALDASLAATTITQKQWRDGMKQVATDASKARDQLQSLNDEIRDLNRQAGSRGPRLEGTERAGAQARLGLIAANSAQDLIQGGPGAIVNNVLGAAGDGKIRALAGEFVEAAGGASALGAALGTVGLAAGAAFLVIDGGLKSAKLGWGDLGSVVDEVAGGAFSGAAKNIGSGLGQVYDTMGRLIGTVADYTVGWSGATDAVRGHKEELERTGQILRQQAEDAKKLAGLKSDAQAEGERKGGLIGKELANLAGPEGVDALIDKLVTARIGAGDGGKRTIQAPVLDDKGKDTGKTAPKEITRREDEANALKGRAGASKPSQILVVLAANSSRPVRRVSVSS